MRNLLREQMKQHSPCMQIYCLDHPIDLWKVLNRQKYELQIEDIFSLF